MKRSDVQPVRLRKKRLGIRSLGEATTEKQRSPPRHESVHRCGSHDSTFDVDRTRGRELSGGHEEQTGVGRPADVAAGDAPIVTRHAVERREVIVVPACSDATMQAGAAAKTSVHLHTLTVICLGHWSRGHNHHGQLLWKSMTRVSLRKDKEDDLRHTAGPVLDHQCARLGAQAVMDASRLLHEHDLVSHFPTDSQRSQWTLRAACSLR